MRTGNTGQFLVTDMFRGLQCNGGSIREDEIMQSDGCRGIYLDRGRARDNTVNRQRVARFRTVGPIEDLRYR